MNSLKQIWNYYKSFTDSINDWKQHNRIRNYRNFYQDRDFCEELFGENADFNSIAFDYCENTLGQPFLNAYYDGGLFVNLRGCINDRGDYWHSQKVMTIPHMQGTEGQMLDTLTRVSSQLNCATQLGVVTSGIELGQVSLYFTSLISHKVLDEKEAYLDYQEDIRIERDSIIIPLIQSTLDYINNNRTRDTEFSEDQDSQDD